MGQRRHIISNFLFWRKVVILRWLLLVHVLDPGQRGLVLNFGLRHGGILYKLYQVYIASRTQNLILVRTMLILLFFVTFLDWSGGDILIDAKGWVFGFCLRLLHAWASSEVHVVGALGCAHFHLNRHGYLVDIHHLLQQYGVLNLLVDLELLHVGTVVPFAVLHLRLTVFRHRNWLFVLLDHPFGPFTFTLILRRSIFRRYILHPRCLASSKNRVINLEHFIL